MLITIVWRFLLILILYTYSMNITKENTDKLNAILKLKVEQDDYAERVNNVLKDYRKQARVDGFRPGMVPMGLIKKMYYTPVLVDEVNKLVSESIFNYLQEENVRILGEPLPHKDQDQESGFRKRTLNLNFYLIWDWPRN
jgi:trigger factor